ncbi:MAG: O-methyltransferase [Syntrophothermus sp.]
MPEIIKEIQLQYLNSLTPAKDDLITEMEDFASKNKVPILYSMSAGFLELLVKIKKPVKLLEIGTAIAYTAIRLGRRIDEGAILYTLEKSKDNIKLAEQYIERAKLTDKVKVIEGDALESMKKFTIKFDFIFLDADKEDYAELLKLSIDLLNDEGVIVVDNLLWHGWAAVNDEPENMHVSSVHIREFNKMFMNHPQLETTILPIGDGIGLGVKKR